MDEWPVGIMMYGAGEAIDGANSLAPQIQAQLGRLGGVCTNPFVAATAQLDATKVPTRRFVLDPSGRQPVLELPNVDVGDPAQLIDFVSWSVATCPATRSVLVLSGHGAAWEDDEVDDALGTVTRAPNAAPRILGALHNARRLFGRAVGSMEEMTRAVLIDGEDRDYLSNAELGAACESVSTRLGRPLDVLVFDACLMSSVEILQELRGSVATVVASIDELSAAGISMSEAAQVLTAGRGTLDRQAIATAIVDNFTPQADFDSCVAVDLANPSWGNALTSFQTFCAGFLTWIRDDPANALSAATALQTAERSIVKFSGHGLADFGALATAVAAIPELPGQFSAMLGSTAAAFASCILKRKTGARYDGATGLSIFTAHAPSVYASNRAAFARLQFPSQTGWLAVLDELHGLRGDSDLPLHGATRTVAEAIAPPPSDPEAVTEFVVSLRGLPIPDDVRGRLNTLVRRVALEQLAVIDLTAAVTIRNAGNATAGTSPPTRVLGLLPGLPPVLGLVARLDPLTDIGGVVLPQVATTRGTEPSAGFGTRTDVELHVVVLGVKLDDAVKATVEAAIRNAVLRELATIDNLGARRIGDPGGDPQTRSIFGSAFGPGIVYGLVAELVEPVLGAEVPE